MVNDKMCITAGDDELMFRIDPSLFDTISSEYQAKVMIMRGKALKGYVTVKENTLSEAALKNLINLSLEFNGKAKRSKEDSD